MPLVRFKDIYPTIEENVFIAPTAWVTGDVIVRRNSSLFFGVVARGDIKKIEIGEGSNLQEHVVVHTSHGLQDCIIGSNVTVGHGAIVHGCTVNNTCIIGMGSTILDGANIGRFSIIGAQALVPMNMKIPERSLVLGVPGKIVRELTAEEIETIEKSALSYQEVGRTYQQAIV